MLERCAQMLLEGKGRQDGLFETPVPGLMVLRHQAPTRPQCILYRPSLCLILQGGKEVALGEARTTYREGQSLIVTADVPTLGHVIEASPERPFVGLGLELDIGELRSVGEQLFGRRIMLPIRKFELFVNETSAGLEDCLARLIEAAERPRAFAILRPAIMREIYYWLLSGPNGERVSQQIAAAGAATRIADVVKFIRDDFARPLRVNDLADRARMSPSTFHQQFKAATSMTPLQFQKQLRLVEARRLLTTEGASVAKAAFRVGYESASQFSREYSRMFGLPPARDAALH